MKISVGTYVNEVVDTNKRVYIKTKCGSYELTEGDSGSLYICTTDRGCKTGQLLVKPNTFSGITLTQE